MPRSIWFVVPLLIAATACSDDGESSPAATGADTLAPTSTASTVPPTTTAPIDATTTTSAPPAAIADTPIAFVSNRDGDWEIWVMDADGANPVQLTNNTDRETGPVWSPDGARIAFFSDRGGTQSLWVMDADGANTVQLTDASSGGPAQFVAWSPDSARIAFSPGYGTDQGEIWVVNVVDGTDPVQLTDGAVVPSGWPEDAGSGNVAPSWSPDGTRIAFASGPAANWQVWVMNADGSDPVQLTPQGAMSIAPAWSPDGTRIAFTAHASADQSCEATEGQPPSEYEVWVMNADGTDPVQVTSCSQRVMEVAALGPVWSPDGTQIAHLVWSTQGGVMVPQIEVVNADGTDPVRLTDSNGGTGAVAFGPLAWSPDGTRIAFSSGYGTDQGAIWVVHADGTDPVQLTDSPGLDDAPSWSPS